MVVFFEFYNNIKKNNKYNNKIMNLHALSKEKKQDIIHDNQTLKTETISLSMFRAIFGFFPPIYQL